MQFEQGPDLLRRQGLDLLENYRARYANNRSWDARGVGTGVEQQGERCEEQGWREENPPATARD